MAIEIVDFPINSMVTFHSYVNVYQRVFPCVLINKPEEWSHWAWVYGEVPDLSEVKIWIRLPPREVSRANSARRGCHAL